MEISRDHSQGCLPRTRGRDLGRPEWVAWLGEGRNPSANDKPVHFAPDSPVQCGLLSPRTKMRTCEDSLRSPCSSLIGSHRSGLGEPEMVIFGMDFTYNLCNCI
jgi:hypothetical protein